MASIAERGLKAALVLGGITYLGLDGCIYPVIDQIAGILTSTLEYSLNTLPR